MASVLAAAATTAKAATVAAAALAPAWCGHQQGLSAGKKRYAGMCAGGRRAVRVRVPLATVKNKEWSIPLLHRARHTNGPVCFASSRRQHDFFCVAAAAAVALGERRAQTVGFIVGIVGV